MSFILRTKLIMGGSCQRHTCVCEFFRIDSLRRHLERGICKQNKQSQDDPSDDSESQQDDEDDNSNPEEDEFRKVNQNLHRGANFYSKLTIVYKTHSTRPVKLNQNRILGWKLQKQKDI